MKLKRFLLRYYPPGELEETWWGTRSARVAASYAVATARLTQPCHSAGIILEYEQAGETRSKCIDLLDLRPE